MDVSLKHRWKKLWWCPKWGLRNAAKAHMHTHTHVHAHISLPSALPYWELSRPADESNWSMIPSVFYSVTISIASTVWQRNSKGLASSKPVFWPLLQECKPHIQQKHTSLFCCGTLCSLLTEHCSQAHPTPPYIHVHAYPWSNTLTCT